MESNAPTILYDDDDDDYDYDYEEEDDDDDEFEFPELEARKRRRSEYEEDEKEALNQSAFQRLSNAVLRRVFQYLRNNATGEKMYNIFSCIVDTKYERQRPAKDKRDLWLSRLSFMDMRDGRHVLLPLARVCRRWNKIATEMLYEEIQIHDCMCYSSSYKVLANFNVARMDDEPRDESGLLRRTLTSSPHLGYLVRRAVLVTRLHEYDITLNHIEILAKCPFVEDLKIHGYNGYHDHKYLKLLPQLNRLRFLAISRYGTADVPTGPLGRHEDWLAILKDLPFIEHVMVSPGAGYYWDSHALKNYCKGRGIYLKLQPEA